MQHGGGLESAMSTFLLGWPSIVQKLDLADELKKARVATGECGICGGRGLVQEVHRGIAATTRCACQRKPAESEHAEPLVAKAKGPP